MTEDLEQGSNGDIEARARAQGWSPIERWRGDPAEWKTAEEFVEFSEKNAGVAQETIKRMEKKLSEVEKDNQRLKEGLDEMKTYHAQTAKREYERAYAKIKEEMNLAVEEGDTERFKKAEAKMDALVEKQETAIAKPDEAAVAQERQKTLDAWIDQHPWYDEEVEMHKFANDVDALLMRTHPNWTQQQFLDEIAKRVQKKFPDYFEKENPRRREAGAVEGGSYGMAKEGSAKKDKGYHSLPAEHRARCDYYTGADGKGGADAKIPGFTRAEWLRDYYGS